MKETVSKQKLCFLVDYVSSDNRKHCKPVILAYQSWYGPVGGELVQQVQNRFATDKVYVSAVIYVPGDWTKQELAGMAAGKYRLPEGTMYYAEPSYMVGVPYREVCDLYKKT